MTRPISWLGRLHIIRATINASVRSHYARTDLQALFEVSERSALNLLDLFPTTRIGKSSLVERDALLHFIQQAIDADDVPALMSRMRAEKSRPKPNQHPAPNLVTVDQHPVQVDALDDTITLARGELHIRFGTVEGLANSLYLLSRVLRDDPLGFTLAFDPQSGKNPDREAERADLDQLYADLQRLEQARG
jgi:hypothetical protein